MREAGADAGADADADGGCSFASDALDRVKSSISIIVFACVCVLVMFTGG